MSLKGRLVLFGVTYLILASCGGTYGAQESSTEEELELEDRIINKTPIKTIQTDYGDIIDCIDVFKQPAFDHPLLRNHKIQMSPTTLQHEKVGKEVCSSARKPSFFIAHGCPLGTVPIRRITKEDLKRSKSFANSFITPHVDDANNGHHFAIIRLPLILNNKFYGGVANLSANNPKVAGRQTSTSQLWIESGPAGQLNTVQAGWIVAPSLYGDNQTRFFGYWTGNNFKNGCFDLICPGFVHTNRNYNLGIALDKISVYDGTQHEMMIKIHQDPTTKNWWLSSMREDIQIGYWPKELFPHLGDGAERLSFGGHTFSPPPQQSPEMGNGHFAENSYSRAGYFCGIQYINKDGKYIRPPPKGFVAEIVDRKRCYNINYVGYDGSLMQTAFLYGGPGGDCT